MLQLRRNRASWPLDGRAQWRLLYYYTDRAGLADLVRVGRLEPALFRDRQTNLELRSPVIWLTDGMSADAPIARAIAGLPESQAPEVRLTVAVADAQRWPLWARRHRLSARALRRFDAAYGQEGIWLWVVGHPIQRDEWLRAEDLRTGQGLPLDK